MKKYFKKNNLVLLGIFIFMLCISFFSPISGDDWGNYVVGKMGLKNMLNKAVSMYFDWEGRFISRLIINLVTYNKIIFNILLSLFVTVFVYIFGNISKAKNKSIMYLGVFLSLFLVERVVFTQGFLWVAGSVTYFFPSILLLIYIFIYYRYYDKIFKDKWYSIVLFSIFSLILSLFVENITVCYVFINIILFIYKYISEKKFNKIILFNIMFSVVGLLIMMLSPGTKMRMLYENTVISDPLIIRLIKNYANFIYYTFTSNVCLVFLFNVVMSLILKKKNYKKKNKILINLFLFIPSTIISLGFILGYFDVSLLNILISKRNVCVIAYYTLYGFLYLYLVLKEEKIFHLLILSALISNFSMLVSPVWGPRTTLYTVIVLSGVNINLIALKINSNIILERLIYVVTGLIVFVYLVTYYNVFRYSRFISNEIDDAKSNEESEIILYEVPHYLVWDFTPYDEWHIKTFKEYYGIEDKEIVYKNGAWKYKIIFSIE